MVDGVLDTTEQLHAAIVLHIDIIVIYKCILTFSQLL